MSDPIAATKDSSDPGENVILVVIKSTWYTVVLLTLLFGGAVIFMGIEGNYDKYKAYEMLDEHFIFNQTLNKWLAGTTGGAIELRRLNNITEDLHYSEWVHFMADQFDSNYTKLQKVVTAQCEIAKKDLTAWDNKFDGDALMYAASIISTVGWGVYYPRSDLCKWVTVLYALLGLPLFAAMCSWCAEIVTYIEKRIKNTKCLRAYMGNGRIYISTLALLIAILVIIYGSLCEWLVESELESIDLQQVLIDTGKGEKWTFFVALYYTMNTVSTIGFGDLYIHCPGHFVLVLKPIVCLMLTALLIAIFSIAFSRIQNTMDKKVAKDALKTREEVKFMMKNKAAIDSVENAECDFKL